MNLLSCYGMAFDRAASVDHYVRSLFAPQVVGGGCARRGSAVRLRCISADGDSVLTSLLDCSSKASDRAARNLGYADDLVGLVDR